MSSTEYMRMWREKNRDKLRQYDRARYHAVKAEKERIDRMGDKVCLTCGILLKSKFGAHKTRNYCRDCRDRGIAKRHAGMLATRRYRAKHHA